VKQLKLERSKNRRYVFGERRSDENTTEKRAGGETLLDRDGRVFFNVSGEIKVVGEKILVIGGRGRPVPKEEKRKDGLRDNVFARRFAYDGDRVRRTACEKKLVAKGQ